MVAFFQELNPVLQALLATLFTWGVIAAGAMILVVVEELIPESQQNPKHIDIVTMATLVGFAVMMVLDVALG